MLFHKLIFHRKTPPPLRQLEAKHIHLTRHKIHKYSATNNNKREIKNYV